MYLPHSLTHSFIHSSHWQNDKIKTFRTFTTSTSIQTSALELKHHHCLWIYEWVGLFFIRARHTIRCWFEFNAFRAFHIWNASHFSIWAMCRMFWIIYIDFYYEPKNYRNFQNIMILIHLPVLRLNTFSDANTFSNEKSRYCIITIVLTMALATFGAIAIN